MATAMSVEAPFCSACSARRLPGRCRAAPAVEVDARLCRGPGFGDPARSDQRGGQEAAEIGVQGGGVEIGQIQRAGLRSDTLALREQLHRLRRRIAQTFPAGALKCCRIS